MSACACACVTLSVTIEFWPAWLSLRMRLSSPDQSPLIARTRVLAIFSSCRFSSYNTASGRFYQLGETFMTHLTYSRLCRPTTSVVAWVFSGTAVPPAYRVKVQKLQVLLTFLMCVNLQHFVTERDIRTCSRDAFLLGFCPCVEQVE